MSLLLFFSQFRRAMPKASLRVDLWFRTTSVELPGRTLCVELPARKLATEDA